MKFDWIKPALEALFEAAPDTIDFVARIVKDEKAKRVEEIRPDVSHSQQAIDDLSKGEP